ncbi:ATPase [Marinifilum flexuosum]|uniref:N-acetylglucosamine kinase-like BadF-type ATPase n=1 Tax=Marinifilum flexuosum TaxID=1117708 RepID=A0A419WX67_9BACT|nr:ATPase [Marinifilum flexuosum]RKE00030.1 N-acetylglucosamine kinase-like BadF-type ATPase [Marinifilum flexuosum]
MILIAESGSTKTDWVFLKEGKIQKQQQTLGINPFHMDISSIIDNIKSLENFHLVEQIFFYGAGCATDETKQKVKDALLEVFPSASCEIHSDVLAAARSVCGREKGIACIIGTGSNSCLYDGKDITHNVRPLGYILGDEGSGAVLGKRLIADILKGVAPEDIATAFYKKHDLEYAYIINKIYREEAPSRFLAQFTVFLSENIEHPYVSNLLQEEFTKFFERNIKQYNDHSSLPIHFIGSIAYYFKKELNKVAEKLNLQTGKIIKSPLEGLIEFHIAE